MFVQSLDAGSHYSLGSIKSVFSEGNGNFYYEAEQNRAG